MPFTRTLQRYGRTPEAETPYQRAGQMWDDRIGAARVQAQHWRLAALGGLGLQGLLIAGLVWIAAQSRVKPFVVEVDKLGEVQGVGPADRTYQPTDAQIAWFLGRFVTDVRALPTDPVLVRRNWLEAYDFVTDRAAVFLSDYARAGDPFKSIGDRSISVEITSVVRASDTSFQVKWTEQIYRQGVLTATERWTAIVATIVQPPHTLEGLRKNPLGLFIRNIAWAREFDAASTPPVVAPPPAAPVSPSPPTALPAAPIAPLPAL
jgi:type IV secretion system protein TrbF